jgi:DNA polymerase-3 subunit gamma/tau
LSEVLYRKWRPRRLDQVVGQETISQTLRQAVLLDRVAHAYLFCGPRGTGKTSTARILAMAVNCRAPTAGEPDNECDMCMSIREGRALDLIEIDAASNRGIDDIRDLSDKVRFTPGEARFKVYIIDEVHMLTAPAFNALLKTLEEPPGHAIFILATTEVHKLPLTIISRCQRFDFRRIPLQIMEAKLADLCRDEGVDAAPEALTLIARRSSGSLRDAENLLEQAVVSYGSPMTEEHVRDMIGLGGDETALLLAEQIIKGDVGGGLAAISEVTGQGSDLGQFHRGVTECLRGLLLSKTGAGEPEGYSDQVAAQMKDLASTASLERLVHALKTFAAVDMRRDSSSPLPLELALLESVVTPRTQADTRPEASAPTEARPAPVQRPAAPVLPRAPQNNTAAHERPSSPAAPAPEPTTEVQLPPGAAGDLEVRWSEVVRALRLTGNRFKLGALLRGCKERELADGVITLKFLHVSHVERFQQELGNPATRREVEETLERILGGPYRIDVSLIASENQGNQKSVADRSPLVRAARSKGAQVIDEREDVA